MSISRTLKQLMKVLLVVFMSLTMIVPDGMVKAENQYLSTDKDVYFTDEPIMVTVTGYNPGAYYWIGIYEKGAIPPEVKSSYWIDSSHGVADGVAVNILNGTPNTDVPMDPNGGEYDIILMYEGGELGYYNVAERKTIKVVPRYILTDKDEYEPGDPIKVTLSEQYQNDAYVWIGLFNKGVVPPAEQSYYYIDSNLYTEQNILDGVKQHDLPTTGEFDLILMYQGGEAGYYNVVERRTIKIAYKEESTLAFNMDMALDDPDVANAKRVFRYDEFEVIASSPNPDAWVAMIKRWSTNDKYYNWYYAKDHKGEPFNIVLNGTIHDGYNVVAADTNMANLDEYLSHDSADNPVRGRYNIVLFKDGGYENDLVLSVILLKVYEQTEWKFEDDFSKAYATFISTDDGTKKTLETTNITSEVTTAPKCEEAGVRTYTATIDIQGAFETKTKEQTFSGTATGAEPATGHDWGEWVEITPATEETEGLERRTCKNDPTHIEERTIPVLSHTHKPTVVEAKDPTCTEDGNIKYYVCSGCGKLFEDEACTKELNDEDVVVKALGHDYSSKWTFDEEKHNHYKECSRCHDKKVEACDFESEIVGCAVVHTCSVCGGSYEQKFMWTDKTVYKQYEPIMISVDLSVIADYPGLDTNTAWVGLYPKGDKPARDTSIRWHYIKNMGDAIDMWATLDSEGGSGWTNHGDINFGRTTPGDYDIYLLADVNYDKTVAYLTVTLTEETLSAGEIKFEFNGKEQEFGQEHRFELPDVDELTIKVSSEEAFGSWVGVYNNKYSVTDNFAGKSIWYKNVEDINGQVIDLQTLTDKDNNKIFEKEGSYTIAVFGDGGYKDIRNIIYIEITKKITSEVVTVEPTCTNDGSKVVTYYDGVTENISIPALGHEWGEFKFDGEEAKTHTKECSRCHEKVTEDCKFASEEKDGIITYTCEVCGGQYTYEKTIADEPVYRTSGSNRYLTAITAADVFMKKTGKDKLDTVVLACGSNFADALAGSYLAAVKDAPILLIDDNEKAAAVENFIKENMVKGGLVYILGGDKAVAPKFEKDLTKAGLTVKRLKGDNRYGTNLEILKEAGIEGDTLLVSVGSNFADSLSASATGLPVLLVKDKLTKEQKDFLSNYSGKKIYILGGPNAVNKTIEGEMGEYGTVKRIQGATRYETSTKIAEQFFKGTDTILLAVGDNFPDGLCGGALAYQLHAPVILVQSGNKADYAKKYVKNNNIEKAVVLGGENAMKKALVNEILGRDPKADIPDYQ